MIEVFISKNIRITILMISVLICSAGYAEHVPKTDNGEPELRLRTAGIYTSGNVTALIEILGNFELEESPFGYRAITAGAYYRLHRNVKAGLFYRLQSGAIHDDDWRWLNPGWEWDDTRNRFEHTVIADISPRFHIRFLPGENWIFSWKNRYEYNFYNGHQSILSRPGITWFYMQDRTPVLSVLFQYGVYVPVNFSSSIIYEHTPYIGTIYHINRKISFELTVAFRNTVWTSSEDIPLSGDPDYSTVNRNFIIGIGLIYSIGN